MNITTSNSAYFSNYYFWYWYGRACGPESDAV